jgi:hypothetical protein
VHPAVTNGGTPASEIREDLEPPGWDDQLDEVGTYGIAGIRKIDGSKMALDRGLTGNPPMNNLRILLVETSSRESSLHHLAIS